MGWISSELVAVALAAMFSPTTLTFCILVVVLSRRPLRSGSLFYLGAATATLAIGVVAAFVLGDAAHSSDPSTPKTWVAIVDVVAAVLILAFVVRAFRRPANPERAAAAVRQINKVTDSPAIAVVGAGAALANPGAFIPLALKEISELNPSVAGYIVDWVFFTLASLLPLALALIGLLVARDRAMRILGAVRNWIDRRARLVAAILLVLVAAALLRNGIAGLTA